MCLAQGPQRSDAGEARTRGPSVSSQALYHWATALPILFAVIQQCENWKIGKIVMHSFHHSVIEQFLNNECYIKSDQMYKERYYL